MDAEQPLCLPEDPLSAIASAVSPHEKPANYRPFEDAFGQAVRKRLWAISDIHLSYKLNRDALEELKPRPNDWLILCGDVGESVEHLELAFKKCKACFAEVFWAPGNHELYTMPSKKDGPRGVKKYEECVEVARKFGVWTPEDPYQLWEEDGEMLLIAPIFTLYDYTFRPKEIKTKEAALAWAKEEGIEATDEHLLHPDPFPTRERWCKSLLMSAAGRLQDASSTGIPLIIVGHWPLREDLVNLLNVPRFSIWCGSKETNDWHVRFNAKCVISGHLHVRRTDWKDGVRFEEVSLGYPKQWKEVRERGLDINDMLREILPGPEAPDPTEQVPTQYRRYG